MPDTHTPIDRPEIVQEVLKEVKAIGATSKESNEKLHNEINELKHSLNDMDKSKDVLIKEKVDKLAESITTRLEAAEEEFTKRVDAMEVALQRLPKSDDPSKLSDELKEDITYFKKGMDLLKGRSSKAEIEIKEADVIAYKNYAKAFTHYLTYGDNALSPDQKRDMLIGEEVNGGKFVPKIMSDQIIKKKYDTNRMRQVASSITIASSSVEFPVEYDQMGSGWVGEKETRTETSTPQFQSKEFQVFEQYAMPRVSNQFLQDAVIDVEAYLATETAARFTREEAKTHFTGTGIKQPRGILTYTAGTGLDQVVQVNVGSSLVVDSFYTLLYDLPEDYITMANGWFMNKSTVKTALLIKDLNGYPILNNANINRGDLPSILGIPVYMATSMPVIAANSLSLAVGYWPDAYQIVDRMGITVIRDPYTQKVSGQTEYMFKMRTGGGVKNPQALRIGKMA